MESIGFYKDQVWPHAYLTAQRAAAVKETSLPLEESLLSLGDTNKAIDLFYTVSLPYLNSRSSRSVLSIQLNFKETAA